MRLTILLPLALYAATGAARCEDEVDVVVVGAGLSGLSAARTLINAGKTVAVLEARDRVGGKVVNKQLKNGGVTELGAAFVGPTQDRVLALAKELGIQTFLEYNSNDDLAYIGGKRVPYDAGNAIPPLGALTTTEFIETVLKIDAMAATVDVNNPWNTTFATEYDNETFQAWINRTVTTSDGRATLEVAAESIWSARSDQLSFLYVLAYVAGAGNETSKGTLDRLISTAGGAQESRLVGGTGLLPTGLASKIGYDKIHLNVPVQCIEQLESGKYRVSGNGTTFFASQVVVAMSPPLAGQISYSPPVPAARQQLTQRMFMGALGKANAFYETPFWRNANLSGQIISDNGTVRATFDDSDANATYGGLLGFIEADQMKAVDNATDDEIIALVTQDYVRYFGPQAANVTEWVIQKWDLEPYSQGGPTALAGVGTFKPYGPALKQAFGGIHWAGTEASNYWPGYMDGAIRSGERAAQEILNATASA